MTLDYANEEIMVHHPKVKLYDSGLRQIRDVFIYMYMQWIHHLTVKPYDFGLCQRRKAGPSLEGEAVRLWVTNLNKS